MLTFILQTPKVDVLANVRNALTVKGQSSKIGSISGTAQYYGEPHSYNLTFDPDGGFVQTFKGPLGETFGFDGKTFWRMDRSKCVTTLDFEDRDRLNAIGLVLTSSWLNPDVPATISGDGYTINLTLKGSGQKETIKVDPKTWLPNEATFPISAGEMKLTLHDWKPVGNRMIPTSFELTEGGLTDKASATEITTPTGVSTFAPPTWTPDDVTFKAGVPSGIECKRAISGHILVKPLINGKDVGWFILDSGAEVMVIDNKVADDLKLSKVGKIALTGVGGTIESSFRQVNEFTLGPATLKGTFFTQIELGQIGQLLGIKLAGIVGGDLFKRSIVSIDLTKPAVDINPRDNFALSKGEWLPMRFSTGNPAVEANTDGAPRAWYRFDTGADGTLTFHAPFVKRHKLLDGKKTTDAGSGGVGGVVINKAGQVKWFELAGHRFESPTVVFATATKGAFAEPYLAGNIGQEFMKPFRIVLDFSGYRIALVPLAQ
jgi:outer membrane lipoprotein-sorting protein